MPVHIMLVSRMKCGNALLTVSSISSSSSSSSPGGFHLFSSAMAISTVGGNSSQYRHYFLDLYDLLQALWLINRFKRETARVKWGWMPRQTRLARCLNATSRDFPQTPLSSANERKFKLVYTYTIGFLLMPVSCAGRILPLPSNGNADSFSERREV